MSDNNNWITKSLGDVFTVSSGEGLSKEKMINGVIPVYGGNGITGFHNKYIYENEKLIIGRVGEHCGNVHITNKYSWITDNALIVSFFSKNESIIFWFYYLKFLELNQFAYSSAQPVITGGILNAINAHIPKQLVKQKKIAKILTTIDQLIEKTQALINKHTAIKQGMMADLFTRGIDLTTGQLRPPLELAPYLYKETKLGWVPKDWGISQLSTICTSIGDGVHYSVNRVSEGIPFLFVSCVKEGRIQWENSARISNETYEEVSKRSKPYKGMILFTVVGSYGHIAYVNDDRPFGFERNIAYLKGNTEIINSKYLFYYLMSDSIARQVESLVVGNAQKLLSLGNLGKLTVSVANKEEQLKINERMDSISSDLEKQSKAIKKYTKIKAGLMQDLLTGKVSINYDENTRPT